MLTNPNAMIGYNDFAQSGSVYDESGVTTLAGFPLSNVLLADLYQPVIFQASTSPLTFTIDLGAVKPLNLIAVLKHNLDYTARMRVQLNVSMSDPIGQEYDSGYVRALPSLGGDGSLPWGSFEWGNAIPQYNLGMYNRHTYFPFDSVAARYITVTLHSPSNTVNPQFFRLWASVGYQPSVNISYDADVTIIDETKVVRAVSGRREYGDKVQRRQLNAGFDLLPRTEMLYNIVGGLYLASGISTPVIFLMEPNDPSTFYAEAVYGNLTQLDKATYTDWLRWATTFSVEEQK